MGKVDWGLVCANAIIAVVIGGVVALGCYGIAASLVVFFILCGFDNSRRL